MEKNIQKESFEDDNCFELSSEDEPTHQFISAIDDINFTPQELLGRYFESRGQLVKHLQDHSFAYFNRILVIKRQKSNGNRAILVCNNHESCSFLIVIQSTVKGWHIVQKSSCFQHNNSCLVHQPFCTLDMLLQSKSLMSALMEIRSYLAKK